MSNPAADLAKEIQDLINSAVLLYDISDAEVVGMLELIKASIVSDALDPGYTVADDDDDDDDDYYEETPAWM